MKKIYKFILLGLVAGGANFTASAQLNCGSTEATQKLYQEHPELRAAQDNYNTMITNAVAAKRANRSTTADPVYIIPIVFHIIHQNGIENISDAQVMDEVAILNRDYRKLNPDTSAIYASFAPIASDCSIEFRLAQIDPNGNCTNGIDRIYSHKTNNADDMSKLNGWPRDKYLNVWVVKTIGTTGVAGYAYYPSATTGPLYIADGVLILSEYIGSIGTGTAFTSRALTHEIGHFLNLQHPWGDTNSPEVACGDDQVTDTPVTRGHLSCDMYNPYCTFVTLKKVLYKFDSVTTTSGTTDPTPLTTTDNVVMGGFSAIGVSANPTANGRFEYSNWGTGAADGATTYASLTGTVNTTKYFEFSINPKTVDSSFTLTGISFVVNRSATGPRTFVVRSNAGGTFTTVNLTGSISPINSNLVIAGTNNFFITHDTTTSLIGSKIALTAAPSTFSGRITPITFRIYAYNAEDAAGSFGIDSVNITGINGLIENTQNYMDYSYCSKMYTLGQKDRMRAALESSTSHRNNLWSPANLAATGVLNPSPCVPHPDFSTDRTRVCKGDVVKFTRNVLYGTPSTLTWRFEGGSPSSLVITPVPATVSPVTVTYNTPGVYKATLVATNAAGTDSVVKTSLIRVDEDWADVAYHGAYTEDFQSYSSPGDFYWSWQVNNYDNNANTWVMNNSTGYLSSKCAMMNGYGDYRYDVDDLVSPSYDLSYTTGNILSFRCAAASSAGASADQNDKLNVYVSINCGQSWNLRSSFHDSTLINNGYSAGPFTPDASSRWDLRTVSIPVAYATSNVRFKFEYTSGTASNSVYLDNINLAGVVGINENSTSAYSLSIFPNPTSDNSTIAYHLEKKADTKITVTDVLGKTVFVQSTSGQPEGDYNVAISKQNLNLRNGIYFIRLSVGNESITKKLIITQ
ncbi:MAG: hypothetical protein JWP12_1811 [Bacteroidetes bacterium]|nr:hypothetical protein [Bacteroidota bacterium]